MTLPPFHPWIENLPVYEPGRPLSEVARELGFDDEASLVKLASNENPLGPSPRAVEAMQAAAAEQHLYPDGGCWVLRQTLSRRLALPMEQIAIGNGSNELLELLGHLFLGPGTSSVYSERAFIVYHLVTHLFGAEGIRVPMADGVTHDLDALAEAVREDTRLVFVANPNNPTGTAVDPGALLRFLDRLPPHVLPVVDEAYVELMPDALRPDVLGRIREGAPLCVTRTFSKVYGLAGLRIGYLAGPLEVVRGLNRVRAPFNVNAMAQAAAVAALGDDAHVERTRSLNETEGARLAAEFTARGFEVVPSVANFLLVRVGGTARDVFAALQREGVITRPMDGYGLPEFLRISIGTAAENTTALRAFDRVVTGPSAGSGGS